MAVEDHDLTAPGPPLSPPIAAAVLAERSPRGVRGGVRELARTLAEGGDAGAAKLPPRLKAAVDAGLEHGCLPEVLDASLQTARDRQRRGTRLAGRVAYPALVLVASAVVAGVAATELQMSSPLTSFELWGEDRPVSRRPFWELFPRDSGGNLLPSGAVRSLVRLASVPAALAGALALAAVAAASGGRTGRWPWAALPFGPRVRTADAESESLRLLSVYVGASRPLPDALETVGRSAESAVARGWAAGQAGRVAGGGEVFAGRTDGLFGRRSIVAWLGDADRLTRRRLAEDADLASAWADAAADRSAAWAQALLVFASAGLLAATLACYWLPLVDGPVRELFSIF